MAQTLKKKILAVKDLKPMKDNVKKHPVWQIERLVHSISTYSEKEPVLLQPLVVDEKNTVLIGNGRLEAIKQLEWKKVEVIVKDGLSKEQKKALSILDNKSISTEWNEDILAQQLPELDDLALDTGFSEKEIRDLIKKIGIKIHRYSSGHSVEKEKDKEFDQITAIDFFKIIKMIGIINSYENSDIKDFYEEYGQWSRVKVDNEIENHFSRKKKDLYQLPFSSQGQGPRL